MAELDQLIAQLIGLGGTGLGLADAAETRSKQNAIYEELQRLYQHLRGLADQQQGRLDTQYGQQQNWYEQVLGQTTADRSARDAAYAQYAQQVEGDRAQRAGIQAQRVALSQRLQDPTQVTAGANALYQDMDEATRDAILRSLTGSLATRGIAEGGVAGKTLVEGIAPYLMQQRQQAYDNYLKSQGLALSSLTPVEMTYTREPGDRPYAPRPLAPPEIAQYPSVSTYVPGQGGQDLASTLRSLSGLIGGVGGGEGIISSLIKLISQGVGLFGGDSGDASMFDYLGGDYAGESDFGSDLTTDFDYTGDLWR